MTKTSFFLYFNAFPEIIGDFDTPWGLLFNKFGNLSIYYIQTIYASNFCSLSYLKCFGTSLLEFEMAELYKNKVKFA